jgi:hypothetical protein
MTMKNLSKILAFPENDDFQDKAKDLMLNYCIKKTSGQKEWWYSINEIELYYYSKDHRDECVHPHFFKKFGAFRVHYSGVDITFESNWEDGEEKVKELLKKKRKSDNNLSLDYNLFQLESVISVNDTIRYGGLLIREIQEQKQGKIPINGPLRVLCELFYMPEPNSCICLELIEKSRKEDDYEFRTKPRVGLGENAGEYKDKEYNYSLKKK